MILDNLIYSRCNTVYPHLASTITLFVVIFLLYSALHCFLYPYCPYYQDALLSLQTFLLFLLGYCFPTGVTLLLLL